VPDEAPLAPERQTRLERRDAALFALDAALLPLAVLVLALPFGTAGVALALGLEYLSRGAVAVRSRQPRLVVLRDKLVRELVAREPASVGAASPMTSPLMAWIQLLAGLVLLGLAVQMRRDGESQALSAPVLWLIGSVAVLMAGAAIRSARLRHGATRAARARAGRPES
jgi:hypothetical protein